MQKLIYKATLTFVMLIVTITQKQDDVYILFEEGQFQKLNQFSSDTLKNDTFSFYIGPVESDYGEVLDPIHFESFNEGYKIRTREELGESLKSAFWLKNTYLETFNFFKNNPPHLDSQGEIITFDLSKTYENVYVAIRLLNGSYKTIKVQQIEIIE